MRNPFGKSKPIVPVVRLTGAIGAGASGRSLSLQSVAPLLAKAFAVKKAECVAFVINSPGGSPAQSALIADRIRELAGEKGRKTVAFVEDAAASGGYWLATATDEIIAQSTSIVGSIGVISSGFGLVGTLEKLGMERRVYTAGTSKSVLDPFREEKPEDLEKLREVLEDLHADFIKQVRSRRGPALEKAGDTDLFTGAFWTGKRGLELGLVDGLGSLSGVMKSRYGKDVQLKVIQPRRRGFPFPLRFGASDGLSLDAADLAAGVATAAEERALWRRLGL